MAYHVQIDLEVVSNFEPLSLATQAMASHYTLLLQ